MPRFFVFVVTIFIVNISVCSEGLKTITIASRNYNLQKSFPVEIRFKQSNGICLHSKSYSVGKIDSKFEYVETNIHCEFLVALNRLDNAQLKLIFYKNLLGAMEGWAITFAKEEDDFFSIQNEDGIIKDISRHRITLTPFERPEDALVALINPANEYFTTIFKFQ